jgi:hypothetical protein
MKRAVWFAVTIAVAIGLSAWAAAAVFGPRIGEAGVEAIVMSAGVAFMVQCLTFGIALALIPSSLMIGWGAGMLVRLFVLVVHGFVGVRLLGLRADAALISLAGFFFLTTLIEPFFLPRPAVSPPPDRAR